MPNNPASAANHEEMRLKALERYDILDSPPETAYDDLTRLASMICDTPIALVTLIDRNRQWFKSSVGLTITETSREVAFCARTIESRDFMEIPDARADARFRDNPLVTGPPHIRFYAGAPLVTPDGYRLGAVCVIDRKPRELTGTQIEALKTLSRQVIAQLELRRTSKLAERASEALAQDAAWQRNLFFERSFDMLVIADLQGHFHTTNPACTRVLGYAADELRALDYFELMHPDDVSRVRKDLATLAGGANVPMVDVRMRTKDGDYRDILWNSVPWTEDHLVFAVGRDITSIRAAERVLSEQELMLRRAEQVANIGSWQYVLKDQTMHLSEGLLSIANRQDRSPDVGLDELLSVLVAEDRDLLRGSIDAVAAGNAPRRIQCRIRRPDGEYRTLQTSMDVLTDNNDEIYGVIGACLDITDINNTVERLLHSEQQLRALTRRLEQVREEERASISREIHDELGQMLTALKLDLTLLEHDLADPAGDMPPARIRSSLRSMTDLVESTIQSVRTIATHLRPEVLDSFGLLPAIEWHANEFQKRTQIECVVEAPENQPELADEARTALFRITQEAMTNAARHADADRIAISIRNLDDLIELRISDNGRGLDARELAAANSLGVLGMRERASMIGASFRISGTSDDGTTVQVLLPLAAANKPE